MRNSKLPKITESQLQKTVVNCLSSLGYQVMETGKARSKVTCKACGFKSYATGWQGNTVGIPDLYIHNKLWTHPIAVPIELKTQTGGVRKEQQIFEDIKITTICRSLADVLYLLQKLESHIGCDSTITKLRKFMESGWINLNE